MKIYFADLGYLNDASFEQPLPLNAAVISGYLLKNISGVDIKIFKHPAELLNAVSKKAPDVLAMTHYAWNANLDMAIARRCKEMHADVKIVMGGPNFNSDDIDWIEWFFRTRPFLDMYIVGEGEFSFLRLIQILLDHNLDLTKSDYSKWPSSFYGFDHKRGKVLHNPDHPVERLDLSRVSSPYLQGLLDEFLDNEHLAPIIETNRGCPFSCAFCVWGQATLSRVRQFDLQNVVEEIRYISKRSKNSAKVLIVADANFGILKRDIKIAEVLMECRDKYGFPERLYIYSTKHQTPHSIRAYEIISPIAFMSMSLQSLNSNALRFVGRKNIQIENYAKNYWECQRRGIRTYCEMIYGLPGESYESFVDGISKVLRSGQERIQLYALLLFWGTKVALRDFQKKHGLKTAFRYQIKNYGTYHDISTLEYEEIVVGTNDMTLDDYFRIRELHFFILLLGANLFKELQRILKCTDYDIVAISDFILEDEPLWPHRFANIMDGFRKACHKELLTKDSLKTEFDKNNIDELSQREIALVPAYICKLFARRANIQELRTYLSNALRRFFKKILSPEMVDEIIVAFNISMDQAVCYDALEDNRQVEYAYDLDAWLSCEQPVRLKDFRTEDRISYRLKLHSGLQEAFERAKIAGTSLENAVYLLKFKFFPLSDDRIFFYIRSCVKNP